MATHRRNALPVQKHVAFIEQLNLIDISSRLAAEQQEAQAPQHTETEQEQKDIDTLRYTYLGEI
jgi:hypothetical protein